MNVEIVITWYNGKPTGLWYDDRLLWETKEVVIKTNLLKTIVVLPLLEAIKYTAILINGLTADRLFVILEVIKIKIAELNKLKLENIRTDLDNEVGNLFDKDW